MALRSVIVHAHAAFVRGNFAFQFATVLFGMPNVNLGAFNATFNSDNFPIQSGYELVKSSHIYFGAFNFFINASYV
jgi:hypothetical protein